MIHPAIFLLALAAGDFTISTLKKEDTVEARAEKDMTVFVVKSPSGIGQAGIERTGEKWPKAVTLRLHLKGLESFQVSNGKDTLHVAVSVQDKKPKVRLWKNDKENAELDRKSPFWMDVAGKDGAFEMRLPAAFFESNPKSITLKWIDYYR